jgi:HSP20 family protein
MTLTTYNPFDVQVDRLFDETFRALGGKAASWAPYCNAWESTDGFGLELALPGWDPKDVKITYEDGVLTVEGSRQGETPESNRTYFVREMTMTSGNFTRSFTLPSYVNAEKAAASFKHGVLSIEFPKREEAKLRQITIEAQ